MLLILFPAELFTPGNTNLELAGRGFSFMFSRIEQYVTLVCIAAIGAGVALYLQDPNFDPVFASAATSFGSIGVLAHLLSHRMTSETNGSLSFIPVLASAAVAPHWITMAAVAVVALVEQIVIKRGALKAGFNTAQQAFAAGLAILAYRGLGGVPLRDIEQSSSLSLFALFLVFFITNSLCVSGALGIVGERRPWTDLERCYAQGASVRFPLFPGNSISRLDVHPVWDGRCIRFCGAAARSYANFTRLQDNSSRLTESYSS